MQNMVDYGFPDALTQAFAVHQISSDGSRHYYGGFLYGQFVYNQPLPPRSVLLLEFSVAP